MSERTLILVVLSVASFAVTFNLFIIVPLLPEISDDFGVSIGIGGALAIAFSLIAALGGLVIGPLIDRSGRRFIILAGLVVFTAASVLSAMAPDFWFLVIARGIAGIGTAGLQSAVFAAVADSFPYSQRSKAMGWVYMGNSVVTIAALPLSSVVSDAFSWRVNFLGLALITAGALLFVWLLLPVDADGEPRRLNVSSTGYRKSLLTVITDRTVGWALGASLVNVARFGLLSTFLSAFFRDVFDLQDSLLGIPPTLLTIGSIPGSAIGGWLGDRHGKRSVSAWGRLLEGGLMILLFTGSDWQTAAFALVFLIGLVNAAQFMNSQALMTELLPEARGTVMATFTASVQFGFVAGAFIGGLVIEGLGYAYLGPVAALLAIISVVPFWLHVHEPGSSESATRVVDEPTEP
jgi:predicted MFS family arabinose efflux permease